MHSYNISNRHVQGTRKDYSVHMSSLGANIFEPVQTTIKHKEATALVYYD